VQTYPYSCVWEGKKKKKKKENELTGSIRTEEPAGEGTPLNSDVL